VTSQQTVARVWDITLAPITAANPLAIDVLRVLAVLAPDSVPRDLLAPMGDEPGLVEVALGLLASYSMVTLTPDTVSVHRLIQAVVATQADAAGASTDTRRRARGLIEQARPGRASSGVVEVWPRWAVLVPHIQALAQHWPDTDPDLALASLLTGVGGYLHARGLGPARAAAASQALAIYEAALGPEDPRILGGRSNVAIGYRAVGRHDEANTLDEQNLADRTRVLGPDHPDTLASRSNLASGYRAVGRQDEAIALWEQTLADRTRVLSPDHPDTLTSRNNLALGYRAVGRHDEAITLDEQNLADRTRVLGPDHPDTLASRSSLALGYRAVGRLDEAITLDEQNLADRTRVLGPDHPDTLGGRNNLALGYRAVGRHDEAITLHEQNLADRTRVLGPDHPDTLASRDNLERARKQQPRAASG
jgi:tetratricopeptide (TPR) repeat protein